GWRRQRPGQAAAKEEKLTGGASPRAPGCQPGAHRKAENDAEPWKGVADPRIEGSARAERQIADDHGQACRRILLERDQTPLRIARKHQAVVCRTNDGES